MHWTNTLTDTDRRTGAILNAASQGEPRLISHSRCCSQTLVRNTTLFVTRGYQR